MQTRRAFMRGAATLAASAFAGQLRHNGRREHAPVPLSFHFLTDSVLQARLVADDDRNVFAVHVKEGSVALLLSDVRAALEDGVRVVARGMAWGPKVQREAVCFAMAERKGELCFWDYRADEPPFARLNVEDVRRVI